MIKVILLGSCFFIPLRLTCFSNSFIQSCNRLLDLRCLPLKPAQPFLCFPELTQFFSMWSILNFIEYNSSGDSLLPQPTMATELYRYYKCKGDRHDLILAGSLVHQKTSFSFIILSSSPGAPCNPFGERCGDR